MRKADQALSEIDQRLRRAFEAERRVLSFAEYLELVESDPEKHTRDASQYLLDMIRSFGSYSIERPAGPLTRYRVFDQEFLGADAVRENLIGHEEVQGELVRSLHNFVRIGRASRLLLLHGPNGSAKSTLAACLMRGLEHYSMTTRGLSTASPGSSRRRPWAAARSALGVARVRGSSRATRTSRTTTSKRG
jgi:serine protein kinase